MLDLLVALPLDVAAFSAFSALNVAKIRFGGSAIETLCVSQDGKQLRLPQAGAF